MPFRPSHRQLEYVVALADAGHFGAAARRCHVSQPTLSVQIAQLERQLGAPLFDRTPGRVAPTVVGDQVVAQARAVLLALDDMAAAAALGSQNLGGLIRLGVAPTFGPYFLPSLLPSVHARFPALEIYIREERPATIERGVIEGWLDVGLGPAPATAHAITFRRLCRETIYLGANATHPVAAGRSTVRIEDLRGHRLLTLGKGHQLFERARELAAGSGADIRDDYEGTSLDALWQMVLVGMGLSLFPELYARNAYRPEAGMVLLTLEDWQAERAVGFFWRAGNGRAAQFEQLAKASDDTCKMLDLRDDR